MIYIGPLQSYLLLHTHDRISVSTLHFFLRAKCHSTSLATISQNGGIFSKHWRNKNYVTGYKITFNKLCIFRPPNISVQIYYTLSIYYYMFRPSGHHHVMCTFTIRLTTPSANWSMYIFDNFCVMKLCISRYNAPIYVFVNITSRPKRAHTTKNVD